MLATRVFDRLDILMLQVLGATAAVAGFYGAAQNLAIIPGIFSMSFTPLLLATAGRSWRSGEVQTTRVVASQSLRATLLVLPLAAAVSACAGGIVGLIFGPRYLPTGSILAILIFGSVASLSAAVATALLAAMDRASDALVVNWLLVPAVAIGHLILIPLWGSPGAAIATTLVACGGATISWLRVRNALGPLSVALPTARILGIAALVYIAGRSAPDGGRWVLVKLLLLCVGAIGALWLSGDVSQRDRGALRQLVLSALGRRPSVRH
jgi:O-antigen/teichoic acid export membrane protein